MSFSTHNHQPSPIPSAPGYTAPTAPTRTKKGLAAAGIACALIGLALSVIKGLLSFGWAFLALGLLLGILAVVLKGQARRLGAVSIVIAVIGSLVAGAFFARIAKEEGMWEALDATNVMTFNPKDARTALGKTNPGEAFDNPLPAGSTVSTEYWDAKINAVNLDATDRLMNYNPGSTPPYEGEVHIAVNITVTYKKAVPEPFTPFVWYDYFTSGGEAMMYPAYIVAVPEGFDSLVPWEVGETRTGNIALPAPAEGTGEGTVGFQFSPDPDYVYVRLQ